MNSVLSSSSSAAEAQFAQRIAQRLSAGSEELPHDLAERLRAARMQALAHRKPVAQLRTRPSVVESGHTVTLGGWWTRIGSVVPLLLLVAGLVTITVIQNEERASELAEVDSDLLTGELPTAAYVDPGFAQFLRSREASNR